MQTEITLFGTLKGPGTPQKLGLIKKKPDYLITEVLKTRAKAKLNERFIFYTRPRLKDWERKVFVFDTEINTVNQARLGKRLKCSK